MNRADRLNVFTKVFVQLLGASLAFGQPGKPLTQKCSSPQFPGPAVAIDSQCGVTGTGKKADILQDAAKNNFCAPDPVQPISFDKLRSLQADAEKNKKINFGNPTEHPLSAKPGATSDRAPLTDLGEGQRRSLEGFILIARQEGAESVNCGGPPTGPPNQAESHDIHISLVPDEESIHGDECDSAVIEMSPHHRPAEWTAGNMMWVSSKHARVRATGQLFFDSSHSPCVDGSHISGDPSRFSLWEIHPIYKFEVCDDAACSDPESWLTLEDWLAKHPNTHSAAHH
jgi:hypothetical protein